MKKNSKKQQIKKITNFLEQIEWLFCLNNFDKNIIIKKEDQDNKTAEIYYDNNYQHIEVCFYPCFFTYQTKEQRKIILHELCHSITLPSKKASYDLLSGKLITEKQINEINEKATSKIENILDALLQNKLIYAKNAYKNYGKK